MGQIKISGKRRRDAVITISVYKKIIGRVVPRAEALQVASQILIDAEQERLYFAGEQQWEGK